MNVVVGVADMKISKCPDDTIVTYSLGSCIAVAIFDPIAKVAGILHFMLPQSNLHNGKTQLNPCMFADTGLPLLFNTAYAQGALKSRLIVKIAGGAQILDDKEFFAIGKRNYVEVKKILWKNQVLIKAEHIGGSLARTMYLDVNSGKIRLKVQGDTIEL